MAIRGLHPPLVVLAEAEFIQQARHIQTHREGITMAKGEVIQCYKELFYIFNALVSLCIYTQQHERTMSCTVLTFATMLKHTASSIAPSVTALFNLSIQSVQVPAEWKKSQVVPIPKSSDQASPSSYRPISLLSILSKTLERHMHWVISSHLTDNKILSDAQWGFSSGKGTVTALLNTTHQWLKMLEDRKDVCAVFF